MKCEVYIAGLIWISVMLCSSCGIRKYIERQKYRTEFKTENAVELSERYQEVSIGYSGSLLTDSTHLEYDVLIYPLDNFDFSLAEGFRGKASQLFISGKLNRRAVSADSGLSIKSHSGDSHSSAATSTQTREIASQKTEVVERGGSARAVGWGLFLLVSIGGIYLFIKRRGK